MSTRLSGQLRCSGLLGLALLLAFIFTPPSRALGLMRSVEPNGQAAAKADAPSAPNRPPHLSLAKLPMCFEPNRGQSDPRVKFLSHGQGYTLFITPGEAVIAMRSPAPEGAHSSFPARPDSFRSLRANSPKPRGLASGIPRAAATRGNDRKKAAEAAAAVVRIALKGAARAPQIGGLERMAGQSNYFIGNDPKQWHTDVPNYAKVELKEVYPGIDLIYHGGEQGRLEYDFRLAPGADPKAIRLSFKGMKKLAIDKRGDLIASVGKSQLVEHAPAIYQETAGGKKQPIAGRWVFRGAHEAGFKVAAYDRTKPIVIDPVLLYSTYLGGSGGIDSGYGIAVDSSGNAYVTGQTDSTDFPTLNAFQSTNNALPYNPVTAFVAKLNPAASGAASLLYSTYLGGHWSDSGAGIAVDSSGNAYVTGTTTSIGNSSCTGLYEPEGCCTGAGDRHVRWLPHSERLPGHDARHS